MKKYYIVIFLVLTLFCRVLVKNYLITTKDTNDIIETKIEDINKKKIVIPDKSVHIKPLCAVLPSRTIIIDKTQRIPVNIVATAYTSDPAECGQYAGITASGKRVSRGMIATPQDIPFGTKIYIEGMGEFIAEDRGHHQYIRWLDRNTIRIDIWMNDKKQALEFGVKNLKGFILIEEKGD